MTGKWHRLGFSAVACVVCGIGCLPRSATALDTPNTLMGIDGMVLRAGGIFRDPGSFGDVNGNDGFNTFQFGSFAVNNAVTTGKGKYDAFRFQKTATGDCCISHNARFNSNTPETIIDATANPPSVSYLPLSSNASNYFPVIDRAAFGQVFDPSEYQISVKFKPLLQKTTADSLGTNPFPTNPTYPPISAALENTSPLLTVGLDLLGGYVWDVEAGTYKRAGDALTYNIGSGVDANGLPVNPELAINTWYAGAPHDAEGYATWTVPVTTPSFTGKSFYYSYGSGDFRDQQVVTNGGKMDNGDGTYSDVTVGFGPNYQQFGGGPSDPSNPGSKLNTPNGVAVMSLGGGGAAQLGLSVEIKSIALNRINPGSIMARIDANSGLSFRFGSGFTYGASQPTIDVSGGPSGLSPLATGQISRFDQSGMTNLIFDERTPDDPNEVNRFLIRGAPSDSTFDATDAVVNVRARLLQPLTNAGVAQSLTIYREGPNGQRRHAGQRRRRMGL